MPANQIPALQPSAVRRHIPELDGLRGLAIVLTMLHHFVLWRHQNATCAIDRIYAYIMETGWIGVEIFFVLSGYLITGILIDAKSGEHYFRNFYVRRVLRIFPLYYFVLVLILFLLPRMPRSPADFHPAIDRPWSYWLYLSNFTLTLPNTSFSEARLVTWSLAIEEQFYLIWPAVIWFCNRRSATCVAASVVALSILSRLLIAVLHIRPDVDYFWTPCHMDGLAIGALIAITSRTQAGLAWLNAKKAMAAGVGSMGTLAVAVFSFSRHYSMRQDPVGQILLYTLVATFSGSILVVAITANGPFAWLLRRQTLRYFGKYSYGLYLFQAIVLAWVLQIGFLHLPPVHQSQLPSQLSFLLTAVIATCIIAMLSWYLMERHFLRLKVLFPETHSRVLANPPERIQK